MTSFWVAITLLAVLLVAELAILLRALRPSIGQVLAARRLKDISRAVDEYKSGR